MAISNSVIINKLEDSELYFANLIHDNLQKFEIGLITNPDQKRIDTIYHLINSLRIRVDKTLFDDITILLYNKLQEEIPFTLLESGTNPYYTIIDYLQPIINGGINFNNLSAISPIIYNNTNGVFSFDLDSIKTNFIDNQYDHLQNADFMIAGTGAASMFFAGNPESDSYAYLSQTGINWSINDGQAHIYLGASSFNISSSKDIILNGASLQAFNAPTVPNSLMRLIDVQTSFVPYSGATSDINIGAHGLTLGSSLTLTGPGSSQSVIQQETNELWINDGTDITSFRNGRLSKYNNGARTPYLLTGEAIQNQSSISQPSANFWISGSGKIDNSLFVGTSSASSITVNDNNTGSQTYVTPFYFMVGNSLTVMQNDGFRAHGSVVSLFNSNVINWGTRYQLDTSQGGINSITGTQPVVYSTVLRAANAPASATDVVRLSDISGFGGGTVTSITSTNSDIGVATSTTTPVLTFNKSITGLVSYYDKTTSDTRFGLTIGTNNWQGGNTFNVLTTFNQYASFTNGFGVQFSNSGFTTNLLGTIAPTASHFIHLPDADGTIALTSQLGAYLPLAGGTLTGDVQQATGPINATSLVNQGYVLGLVNGLNWKHSVKVTTTGALPTYTVSPDFQILTATTNGALPAQDGITLVVGDYLLVKNEITTNRTNNGSYIVTQLGDASNPYILIRTLDSSTSSELQVATYSVREGTTQKGQVYAVNVDPVILGTTQITFALTAGPNTYMNGTGIALSSNIFSLDLSYTDARYALATRTVAGFALSGNVTLAGLTSTDTTLTFSGAYNGSIARTIGLNLGNTNIYTANQTAPKWITTGGTNSQVTLGDGTLGTYSGGVTGLANPTGTVGLTTVNGTATTAMRSDAAPALSQAIAPTWTGVHTYSNNILTSANNTYNIGSIANNFNTIYSNGFLSNTQLTLNTINTNSISFQIGSVEKFRIFASTGNVTINTAGTDNGTDKLQVSGSIISSVHRFAGATSGIISILPQAAAGTYNFNLPITAGTAGQVLTSQGGASTAMIWSNISNTPQTITTATTAVINTKYIANGTSLVVLTIPTDASSNIGDQILIRGLNTGLWKLAQPEASTVIHGASDSTVGTAGFVASQARYDTCVIEKIATNQWTIVANRGTLTIS